MSVANTGGKDDDDDEGVLLNTASTINNVKSAVDAQVVGMPRCKERFRNGWLCSPAVVCISFTCQ